MVKSRHIYVTSMFKLSVMKNKVFLVFNYCLKELHFKCCRVIRSALYFLLPMLSFFLNKVLSFSSHWLLYWILFWCLSVQICLIHIWHRLQCSRMFFAGMNSNKSFYNNASDDWCDRELFGIGYSLHGKSFLL